MYIEFYLVDMDDSGFPYKIGAGYVGRQICWSFEDARKYWFESGGWTLFDFSPLGMKCMALLLLYFVRSSVGCFFLSFFFLVSKLKFIESVRRPLVYWKYTKGNT
jgi:hypothetical protein